MKTVVYSCPFVPAEWIAAHGLKPSRILPQSAAPAPAGTTAGLCPYARTFVHCAGSESGADAVIVTTLCDQMRRCAELIARQCNKPVFLMNLPTTWQTAAAHKLYLAELKRLGGFLLSLGGAPPSNEKLAAVMLEYDSARAAIRAAGAGLSARRYSEAIAEFHQSGPPDLAPAEEALASGGVRLAILGGPMLRDDFEIFDIVREAGGRIVLDATDTGERTLPAAFDRRQLRSRPLLELADAYFGSIPHAFRRPNSALYSWLDTELSARDVSGIIYRRYVWCDIWHAELRRLKDWTALPVLDLDIDGEGSVRDRLAWRILSFLEMLG
jgi:benzoyl-CoA reductase/2-hydroxyglutaryl-CoA dehydratase subunit BcrC/BadD/HgdB